MASEKKLWTGEVKMMYPKQWIVMIGLEEEINPLKTFGVVHLVTADKKEAYKTAKALCDSGALGDAMVVEGWNDTPQIGGLEIWSR